jgi:putative N6-adenine-specific DNA methylase
MAKEESNPEEVTLVAKTFAGLEPMLARELVKLGAREVEEHTRSVSFKGDLGFVYKANLCLRTALKILWPIHRFKATNEKEFYAGIQENYWNKFMDVNETLAVETSMNTELFRHSMYMSQLTKDAIVDQFRKHTGKRPSVDQDKPHLRINIHIYNDEVTVSLDTSGDHLYKRGYRVDVDAAPLNEVLAAGMIMHTGWDGAQPLLDPMCGSGTITIEAAMMAANIPANIARRDFAFMRWENYDETLYDKVREGALNKIKDNTLRIMASDKSEPTLLKAKANMKSAGVEDMIKLTTANFFKMEKPYERGIIIMNPPYGERLRTDDTAAFYKAIGDKFKNDFQGYEAWIIAPNSDDAIKSVGLRPSRRITLYNGAIECKFHKYEMYLGTKKLHKIRDKENPDDKVRFDV